MEHNTDFKEHFNYFSVCETCEDDECCSDPYFTFIARNEIDKVRQKVKEFAKIYHNFLDVDFITYKNKEYEWYGIKKVRGRCIFLKRRRICMIHEVKPLHCRCFPLVWGYEEEGNKLFIYIDTHPACALVPVLSSNQEWIDAMKQTIIREVQKMPIIDRIAYNSLEGDDSLQLIDVIDLPQGSTPNED